MTITLYDLAGADPELRFSPYCWRTKMALKHKGLSFETVPWRFTERDALAPSGQARVPVIVDHGQWVADSWRIAQYLDQKYPSHPTLIRDAVTSAHLRLIMSWADSLHGIIAGLAVMEIYHAIDAKDQAYFRQSREERFGVSLEALTADRPGAVRALAAALHPAEQTLRDQPWLGGTAPDYADYALFGTLMWPYVVCRDGVVEPTSLVGKWFERMLDFHEGYARSAPTVRG